MAVLWIHWVSAAAFIGGMVCYIWVFRAVPVPGSSEEILRWKKKMESRFRSYRWTFLVVLLGTGVLILVDGGVAARISTPFGSWLLIKLLLVAVLISLTGLFDFLIKGPKKKAGTGSEAPSGEHSVIQAGLPYGILAAAAGIFLVAGMM